MTKTCETCKWWGGAPVSRDEMECLRYPPQVVQKLYLSPGQRYPRMKATDFCGEHSPREEV